MRFTEPLYLLLFFPAFAWLFWLARQIHGMPRTRRVLVLCVRCLVLACLILALAGMQGVRTNKGVSTIFLLDRSSSMTSALSERSTAYISDALKAKGADDQAGLIVFGANPVIDTSPGSLQTLNPVYAQPDMSSTDIASAIRLSTAAFGTGTAKRIVLLSDGNETDGDAAAAASAAAADDIQIDYLSPDTTGRKSPEVVVQDLVLPDRATKGQPFVARVTATATAATGGTLRLDRDGVPVAAVSVHLTPGANSLVISQIAPEPGFYRYRAVLTADQDTETRNNVALGFLSVQGKPKVLLLQGSPGTGTNLANALRVHDIDVQLSGPEGLPTRPEDLQGFDSVLLEDFSASLMSPQQMSLIASSVRDSGTGFGMIGGENSFLPGGYFETPIADALPVDLNIRQRNSFPSTTIVIVMDTSGSMGMIEDGQQKVKIAASAAAGAVRMMSSNDWVGVAGSTDDIRFVAPIQHPVNKDDIAEQIGKLSVGGGGIYIRPSLEFADKALDGCNTRVRHLILMADGNDCDTQEGAIELALKMAAKKMTISVVAIGDGKDVQFLRNLAAAGKGSFYLALHANQLQRLFTRDASVMSRSAIEEGAFLPKVDPSDEVLRGIDLPAMPPLYAYDLSGDRPLSRIPMRTQKNDPLLAFWQYGLGTSMAFMSDAQPKWARRWMDWNGFSSFWAQSVRSTFRQLSNNRLQVSARRQGAKGLIEIHAMNPDGTPINNLAAKVRVMSQDGIGQSVAISQQGPGRYEGTFDTSGESHSGGVGSYIVSVAEANGSGAPRVTRAGFGVAYPPEFQAAAPNVPLLQDVAQKTNGIALESSSQAFRANAQPGQSVRDLWPLLLMLAAGLFVLDIAVRRVVIPVAELFALGLGRAGALVQRRSPAPTTVSVPIARLQQAKRGTDAATTRASSGSIAKASPADSGNVTTDGPVTSGRATGLDKSKSPNGTTSGTLTSAQRLLDAKRRQQK